MAQLPPHLRMTSLSENIFREWPASSTLFDDSIDTIDSPLDQGLRILLGHRDRITGPTLKAKLEELGHDVYLTINGERCVDAYTNELFSYDPRYFDLVIMRLNLNSITGMKAARRIRNAEEDALEHAPRRSRYGEAPIAYQVPILAILSTTDEPKMPSLIEDGFDGWLIQPFDYARVEQILQSVQNKPLRRREVIRIGQWYKGGWFENTGQVSPVSSD
ncbi:hypothetical protein BJY04DRAFT_145318 [Aspergillus karnatakaensis]|uniref:uncharacterized protein n=1 Tax=Aspergillus karnatakaensis TaxID=1810916 RepID=UPI003CCE2878